MPFGKCIFQTETVSVRVPGRLCQRRERGAARPVTRPERVLVGSKLYSIAYTVFTIQFLKGFARFVGMQTADPGCGQC